MKKMIIRTRYPGFLFPVTALRSKIFSAIATHYTTTAAQAQAHHHHQPPAVSDHLEALIGCQVRPDNDPVREMMSVVKGLKKATQSVEKKLYVTGSHSSYYAYVNRRGGGILTEITRLRKVSEDQTGKLDSLKKEHSEKLEAFEKKHSAKLEALEKELSSIVQWAATMNPIHQVGISIRKRFFNNYLTSAGNAPPRRYRAIDKANKVARRGDFQTDTLLMKLGHLGSTRAFQELYGVPYNRAEYYLKSKMMVAMINKRATMIANRRRITRQWDRKLQGDFELVLLFFQNASEEERGEFERGEAKKSPERDAWSAISAA